MKLINIHRRFLMTGVLAVFCQLSQAQVVVLNHNNSSASINTSSSAGMFNWTVDGQNVLAQQWFWYRVGLNPEAPINTISAPTITTPDARTVYSSYFNGNYGVRIDYLLTGFSAGSGHSDIAESISITNATAVPLDFHFFQYSDFDLGVPGGDLVALSKNTNPLSPFFGFYNTATQVEPLIALTETVLTPGANHGEAAFFNATLVKLNNGVADNLNDAAGPVGPGNVTWALQWDFLIPAYSSLGISKDKTVHINPVPEPSSLALIGLATVAIAFRRKNRSK